MPAGSQVYIYSDRDVEWREANLKHRAMVLEHLTINQVYVPRSGFSACHELETHLNLLEYSHFFILADSDFFESGLNPDTRNVAMLASMKFLLDKRSRELGIEYVFNPVVEVWRSNTMQKLKGLDITNTYNIENITARVLAMASSNPEVFNFLESTTYIKGAENHFDLCSLQEFLAPGEDLPSTVCFADLVVRTNPYTDRILIGWSSERGKGWDVNPKDKCRMREWKPKDQMVFICESRTGGGVQQQRQPLRHATTMPLCHFTTSKLT